MENGRTDKTPVIPKTTTTTTTFADERGKRQCHKEVDKIDENDITSRRYRDKIKENKASRKHNSQYI